MTEEDKDILELICDLDERISRLEEMHFRKNDKWLRRGGNEEDGID